jgi:hypothetical protein
MPQNRGVGKGLVAFFGWMIYTALYSFINQAVRKRRRHCGDLKHCRLNAQADDHQDRYQDGKPRYRFIQRSLTTVPNCTHRGETPSPHASEYDGRHQKVKQY